MSERSTLCRVWAIAQGKGLGHGLRPWNAVWLPFDSWVNSYAKDWEDHPSHWETTHSSYLDSALELSCHLWVCQLAYSSVRLTHSVQLFVTPWTTRCQASLSITNSWSLPKLMSIKSVMRRFQFIASCLPCQPQESCSSQ